MAPGCSSKLARYCSSSLRSSTRPGGKASTLLAVALGVALAMLIASWFMLAIGFKLLRPSLAVSALWLPCFYPYLWQGVFAGGWLLCRPDPLALPARQVLASDALALALGHLGVLAGGLFSQDIRHAYWYRPAAMTLVFWVDDVDAVHQRCLQHGLDITWPPTNMPWGVREMHVRHPDGHVFRISRGIAASH